MSYGSFKDCRILNRDIAAALNIAFIAQVCFVPLSIVFTEFGEWKKTTRVLLV